MIARSRSTLAVVAQLHAAASAVSDRRERVAQLVAEHGEELVLGAAGGERSFRELVGAAFGELAVRNVGGGARKGDRNISFIPHDAANITHPAHAAVRLDHAHLHRVVRVLRDRVLDRGVDAWAVIGVHS